MATGFRLPAYDVPNRLLDLTPLNSAIDGYREQMNTNAQFGLRQRQDDRQQEEFDARKKDAVRQRLGNLALLTMEEQDQARRAEKWGKVIATHPDAANLDPKYHDPETGVLAVLGDANMAQTYLDHQIKKAAERRATAQLGLSQAEASRAAELHKYKIDELTNPVSTVDLGPDHARVTLNKRTGQEIARIQGNPKGPDSTTRKAIFEAQDELPNIKGAIDALTEAKSLLPSIYTGVGANLRSTVNQAAPGMLPNIITDPNRAKATQRYNQIMDAEAVAAMGNTLKGASTDYEMKTFTRIVNDPNVPVDVKVKTIDAMIRKAQLHHRNKVDRIKEFGGRMPGLGDKPDSGAIVDNKDPLGIR